jgi:hypothetical protein
MRVTFVLSIFLLSLLFLIPKKPIYYKAEEILSSMKIVISNEILSDNILSLGIQNATIYIDKKSLLHIDSIDIKPYKIYIKDIAILKLIKLKIDTLMLSYSITSPKHIDIKANIDNAILDGVFDIATRTITLKAKTSSDKLPESIARFMKKIDGEYRYEYQFKR